MIEVYGYQGLAKDILNPDGTITTITEEKLGEDETFVVEGGIATTQEVDDFLLQTGNEYFVNEWVA